MILLNFSLHPLREESNLSVVSRYITQTTCRISFFYNILKTKRLQKLDTNELSDFWRKSPPFGEIVTGKERTFSRPQPSLGMMERDSRNESPPEELGLETHLMDRHSDIELVAKAKAGDEDAFARLFDIHFTMVFGVASSTVRDMTAAQDITQEVFLAAWKKMGDLRNEGAFPMWLRRMTRNLSISWLRNLTYRRELAERSGKEPSGSTVEESSSQRSIRDERLEHIWVGLNTLRPKLRDAVVLYYLEGRSVAEAAKALGITPQAMKSRLQKGRTLLKAHFESNWEDELRSEMLGKPAGIIKKRLASTMSIGPIIPLNSSALSPSGLSLWFHQWIHGGTSSVVNSALQGGVIVMSAKKIMIAAAILILAIGGFVGTRSFLGTDPNGESIRMANSGIEKESDSIEGSHDSDPIQAVESDLHDGIEITVGEQVDLGQEKTKPIDAESSQGVDSDSPVKRKEHGEIEDPEEYVAITGQVVDKKGNGIAGAAVTAHASGYTMDEVGDDYFKMINAVRDPQHQFTTTTDQDGRYSLGGIRYEGALAVRARATGHTQEYRSQVIINVNPGDILDGVDVLLSPGVTAPFQVVSAAGLPVSDGIVTLYGYRVGTTSSGGLVDTIPTDSEGRFVISIDGPGVAAFNIQSPLFGSTSFSNIPITRDAKETRLVLDDTATLQTSITWGDGSPAVGVQLVLHGEYDLGDGRHQYHGTEFSGTSNVEGYHEFAMDPGLSYKIELLSQDKKSLSPLLDIGLLEAGEAVEWDYVIEQPIVVRGTVYGKVTGKPLRDVQVDVLANDVTLNDESDNGDENISFGSRTVKVDSNGQYELRILGGPGEYHIYPRHYMRNLYAAGYDIGETIHPSAGEELHLDLVLPDTFTMSILLLDIDGNPIEDANVCINESGNEIIRGDNITNAEGRWSWSGFQSGEGSSVSIYAGGRERVRTDTVYGQPGEIVPEQIMLLHDYGGIEGLATDINGRPLTDTEIHVTVTYADNQTINVRLKTDELGEFVTLDRIPATAVYIDMQIKKQDTPLTWRTDRLNVPADQVVMLGTIIFSDNTIPAASQTDNGRAQSSD